MKHLVTHNQDGQFIMAKPDITVIQLEKFMELK